MKMPTKKLKNGFEISVLGMGTWEMGGSFEKEKDYDEGKDILAIRMAIEVGYNRFDTAEKYAGGYSEEILGKAIHGFDRSKLVVTSKIAKENLRYDDVLRSARESLKRLDLEYLDLYLIHAPNHSIPIKETMKALDKLKEDGLIKNIGVSNFNVDSLKEAQENTTNKIVLNQVHYNLIFREPVNAGLLDYCQKNDTFIEAWRPVQKGSLAKAGITAVDGLCKKYGKTPAQIAINWLISQDNVVTIVKASNISHLKENLGAVGWEMEKADIDFLSKEFPTQLNRSNVVQLG